MHTTNYAHDILSYITYYIYIHTHIYIYICLYLCVCIHIHILHRYNTHTHTHTHGFTHNMTVFDMTYMTYMYIHMTMYDMAVCHIHYPCICIDRRIKDMTTPPSSVPAGCGVPIQS